MRSRRLLVAVGLVASLMVAAVPIVQASNGRASFIVVLDDSVDAPRGVAAEHSQAFGADVTHVYRNALKGYSARIDEAQLGALRADKRVAYIERDQVVTIDTTQQNPASWGLDRIDQPGLPLSKTFTYASNGAGVTAYVIDTGIRTTHGEFGGRASSGYDVVDGGSADDCNGHGTHVAGTIGGATYGVAKGVTLVAVRVLDCGGSGTWAGVIAGIDWVAGNALRPAVANMSLGGGASTAVDTAVKNAIASGVTFAVAAGNSNADACRYSPARVPDALTVGATTQTDAKASYSNFGKCLDLFAPGSGITSAWNGSDTASNTISGTSMTTPHVAGVAALWLGLNPASSPVQVVGELAAQATQGVVGGLGGRKSTGSPNLLLHTSY